MKKQIATWLSVGLLLWSTAGWAQDDAAKVAAKPAEGAAAKPAEAPAAAVKAPEKAAKPAADVPESDVIQLLQFAEETPLAKVIRDLAFQARTNIQFDPAIVALLPTNTSPAVKFENITPQSALKALLGNYGLMLMADPETGVGRVTKKPTEEPLITRVIQMKYSNPSNVADIVKASFPKNKATAFPDARTAQLVVAAIQREMEDITNLVDKIDLPTKQVLIEARIMETSKNPKTVKGIDWSGTLSGQTVGFGNGYTEAKTLSTMPGTPATTTTTLPSGRTVSTTMTPNATETSTRETTFSGLASLPGMSLNTAKGFNPSTAFLTADGLKAVLSFLNQDNDVQVVATPRAVTLDNETANLSVTRAFPVFKFTPGSANVASGVDVTWTNLGTILMVTPRITANAMILMDITPEVSSIDSKDTQIISGQQNQANVYAIRKIHTKVMIPSGNTLVMGGLMSDSSSKGFVKVPVLGDIPGLGMAFRKESKERNKQNLIIFVTPTIVTDHDYQPTPTDFLKEKFIDQNNDDKTSAWDSGKPKQWGKEKSGKDR